MISLWINLTLEDFRDLQTIQAWYGQETLADTIRYLITMNAETISDLRAVATPDGEEDYEK